LSRGNKQPRNFALFLLFVGIATSLVYRASNRDWISLASAERHAAGGRYEAALPLYEALSEKNFQPEVVYKRLAECLFILGQPREARQAMQKLIAYEQHEDPILLRKLAASALWLGLFQDAAVEYRQVLRLEPDDRMARLGLARALAWSGHFEEAVNEYRILLEGE